MTNGSRLNTRLVMSADNLSLTRKSLGLQQKAELPPKEIAQQPQRKSQEEKANSTPAVPSRRGSFHIKTIPRHEESGTANGLPPNCQSESAVRSLARRVWGFPFGSFRGVVPPPMHSSNGEGVVTDPVTGHPRRTDRHTTTSVCAPRARVRQKTKTNEPCGQICPISRSFRRNPPHLSAPSLVPRFPALPRREAQNASQKQSNLLIRQRAQFQISSPQRRDGVETPGSKCSTPTRAR